MYVLLFKCVGKSILFHWFAAQIPKTVMKNRNLQYSVNVSLEVRIIIFYLKQASLAFLGYDIRFNVPEVVVEGFFFCNPNPNRMYTSIDVI